MQSSALCNFAGDAHKPGSGLWGQQELAGPALLSILGEWMQQMKNIFVGNIPFTASADDVRALFEQYGEVLSAKVITDRDTGRSRGFGFVEMPEAEADAAISALGGYEMDGRPLRVNEAMERRERQPRHDW